MTRGTAGFSRDEGRHSSADLLFLAAVDDEFYGCAGDLTLNTTAPTIQFVAFASGTEVIGIEPDGSVHYSADAGTTWIQQAGSKDRSKR